MTCDEPVTASRRHGNVDADGGALGAFMDGDALGAAVAVGADVMKEVWEALSGCRRWRRRRRGHRWPRASSLPLRHCRGERENENERAGPTKMSQQDPNRTQNWCTNK